MTQRYAIYASNIEQKCGVDESATDLKFESIEIILYSLFIIWIIDRKSSLFLKAVLTLFEFLSNSQKFCFLNCFSFGLWTVILYPSTCWVSPGTVSLQHLSWHVSLGSVRRHGACHHHLRESINVAIKCKQGTILDTQRELMIRHESGLLSLSVKQHSANVRVLLQSWSWSRWKRGQRGRLWPPATTWKGHKPTRVTQVASQDSWSVAFRKKKNKKKRKEMGQITPG